MEQSPEDRVDPMVRVFPRVAKCHFHKFGSSGNVETHDAVCVLPLNIINEKVSHLLAVPKYLNLFIINHIK